MFTKSKFLSLSLIQKKLSHSKVLITQRTLFKQLTTAQLINQQENKSKQVTAALTLSSTISFTIMKLSGVYTTDRYANFFATQT